MRRRVERFRDAEHRERPVAHFARHHERGDAGDVGLERDRHQVEHQLGVLLVIVRNAAGRRRHVEMRNCAFCFSASWMRRSISRTVSRYSATRLRSFAPRSPCSRRTCPVTASRMLRCCSMRCSRSCGGARRRRTCVEDHARIDFHRQRRGRRPPRNRVHVGATEADVAGADQPAVVFGRQFERRQRRVLADLLRRDLIDRDAGAGYPRLRSASGARRSGIPPGSAYGRRRCRRALRPAIACARLLSTTT